MFHFSPCAVYAVCFSSSPCCRKRLLPIRLDTFLCKLADRTFLKKFILLLPSWVSSSVNITGPDLEAVVRILPPKCLTNHKTVLSLHFDLFITLVEVNLGSSLPLLFLLLMNDLQLVVWFLTFLLSVYFFF